MWPVRGAQLYLLVLEAFLAEAILEIGGIRAAGIVLLDVFVTVVVDGTAPLDRHRHVQPLTGYPTPVSVSPSGGAVGPPAARLQAASAVATSPGCHWRAPTSFNVPTMLRT